MYTSALLFSRFVFAKRIPKIDEIFPPSQRSGEMSDDQMFEMARMLNARYGGDEVNI